MKQRLLFICLISFSLVLKGQVNDGLVGEFSFTEGSFSDATGQHDCVLSNQGNNQYSFVADRFGNDSCAIDLRGAVFFAGGNSRDISTEISVSLWIKTTDTPGGHRYILTKYGYNHTDVPIAGYSMIFDDSVRFDSRDEYYAHNTYMSSGNSNMPVNDGEWHHLVGISRNMVETVQTVVEIWVDGEKRSESIYAGLTTKLNNPARNLCIGGNDNYTSVPAFIGVVDDIQIFNRALDSAETVTLMNAQNPFQAPAIQISASEAAACVGAPIHFEAITTDADTIEWHFGDGSVSKETAPSHTYTEAGEFIVAAIATNGDNGITSIDTLQGGIAVVPVYSDTVTVNIDDTELPYIFGTQSLAESGTFNETFQSVSGCDSTVTLTLNVVLTGLKNASRELNGIRIWPNPSSGFVFVQIDPAQGSPSEIDVFNITGQKVLGRRIPQGSQAILDLSALGEGWYLVKVKNSASTSVHRVLMQKER